MIGDWGEEEEARAAEIFLNIFSSEGGMREKEQPFPSIPRCLFVFVFVLCVSVLRCVVFVFKLIDVVESFSQGLYRSGMRLLKRFSETLVHVL